MMLRPRNVDLFSRNYRKNHLLHGLLSEIGDEMVVWSHARRPIERLRGEPQMRRDGKLSRHGA